MELREVNGDGGGDFELYRILFFNAVFKYCFFLLVFTILAFYPPINFHLFLFHMIKFIVIVVCACVRVCVCICV